MRNLERTRGARTATTIGATLVALGLWASCGDDASTDDATSGSGGAPDASSSTVTSASGTGGATGAGGDAGAGGAAADGLASLLSASSGSLLRIRVEADGLADDDDTSSAWRLELDGAEIDLGDPADAGVLAWREPDDVGRIVAVYIQARAAAAPGDEIVVEHRASGKRWTFEAREEAGPGFVLHPIVLRDPDGAGTEADVEGELAAAWGVIEAACGIALEVAPAVDATVDDPDALVEGITAIDDDERPADLLVPRRVDEVFDAAGAPDDELRLLVWSTVSPVAIPPSLYELYETFRYVPTVLLYDGVENGELVGAELTDAPRYRFAMSSDEDSESSNGDVWPWADIAVHEIGHMLGMGHPDATSETDDDFTDNLMAGAHAYPETFGEVGELPNVTQRQCLQMSLDLNGYGTSSALEEASLAAGGR